MIEESTKKNVHNINERITFQLRYENIKDDNFLFLGQAIFWIMSRGRIVVFNDADDEWQRYTECALELFRAIDTFIPVVQGYPVGSGRIYEHIPDGIWASLDLRPNDYHDPFFSPIDDTREDGGSIHLGNKTWVRVRLPSAFMFKHWPALEDKQLSDNTVAPRKGAPSRYDWAEFAKAAVAKLELEGFPDPAVDPKWNQSALEMYMANWCSRNWGKEPSESTIRKKVGEQLAQFKQGRLSR